MDDADIDAAMEAATPLPDAKPVPVKRREMPEMMESAGSAYQQAIAAANQFPRSLSRFRSEALSLATLNPDVAAECVYSVPRSGKAIKGPSVRFAEILQSNWGHLSVQVAIVEEGDKTVTARARAWDMQSNTMVEQEAQRSIVDKRGKRFNSDMVRVTCNAAMSIARRNAILAIIPKPHWSEILEQAEVCARGDAGGNLQERREALVKHFEGMGVDAKTLFWRMGVDGVADITVDHITEMRALASAIKGGDLTVGEAFDVRGDRAAFDPEQIEHQGEPAEADPIIDG